MLATLQNTFGFSQLRAGQEPVIRALLDGRSALAVFPTGGGKSLCYQLPALLLEGVTLVISPLIALMKDQVDALVAKGVPAARLDSTRSSEEVAAVYDLLQRGALKLLYIAPERLASEGFRQRLGQWNIALVAIDEAHCISEWGHNFRPDYLKLARLCKRLGVPRVLALTATATPEVAGDICREFGIAAADHIQLSFHRRNLELRVTPCTSGERRALLEKRLHAVNGAAVVYVTRQETAEGVATFLARQGFPAAAYHAGLRDEVRAEVQERFMRGELRVVVATIAFGMGIDKADIRAVVHFNLPKSLENYTQEIGRAGRDGNDSVCELFACGEDLVTLENFIFGDTPTPQAVRGLMDRILRLGREFDLSLYELSVSCDIRPLVVSTLLTYLELEGVLTATGAFYATYSVRHLRDPERMLAGHNPRRKRFLQDLFACGQSGSKWTRFEVAEVADQLQVERSKIVSALTWLEEMGDIVIQKSGVRQGYRLLQEVSDIRGLADRLNERFARREASDLQRLREVLSLASYENCLTGYLTRHFGEELAAPCGHCDRCRGVAVVPVPEVPGRTPGEEEWAAVRALVRERHAALASARPLARFLCGLSSPATTRSKLTRHPAFGLFADLPFREVLAMAEAQY